MIFALIKIKANAIIDLEIKEGSYQCLKNYLINCPIGGASDNGTSWTSWTAILNSYLTSWEETLTSIGKNKMTTPKQPKWIIVLVPSNPKDLDFLLETIEEIDPDIRWGSGELPPELDKRLISTYIWYQTKDSTLHTSPQSYLATINTTNTPIYKDTASFLNRLKSFKYVNKCTSNSTPVTIPNGAHASKQAESSKWNCICSKCNSNAYQSPFSFECENGCQGATGKDC